MSINIDPESLKDGSLVCVKSDDIVYIIGDDNEPMSCTLEEAIYHQQNIDDTIEIFTDYDECKKYCQ